MKTSLYRCKPEDVSCDVLVVGVFEDGLDSIFCELDKRLNGNISHLIKEDQFCPDWAKLHLLSSFGAHSAKSVLLVGLGKRSTFNLEHLRRISGISIKVARDYGQKIVSALPLCDVINTMLPDRIFAVAEGVLLGNYRFEQFKSGKSKEVESVQFLVDSIDPRSEESMRMALIISGMVNLARDMVHSPASVMTPAQMALIAKRIASDHRCKARVYGRDDIISLGMHGLFVVSKGSTQEPKLIVMEHRHDKAKKTIAIVGKGITFDSGGLSIKPADSMEDMKADMAGAAAVMAAMGAIAQLKLPINVIGIMPCTENMPGGSAYKPGDIVKTHSRKTVEVLNTDAEGRIILADALSYAEKAFKPDAIIDLATLTGACMTALGREAAGLISSDDRLSDRIIVASIGSGERVWRLPLYDEYREAVKSKIADTKNIGLPKGEAGAITAAAFLDNFVEKTPFAHLDIAGPASLRDEKDYIPKGGSGFGVRLLVHLIRDWSQE